MYKNGKRTNVGATLFINEQAPNIDYRYGPYKTLEEAFDYLGEENLDVIVEGLTIGIETKEGITEYWFKNGTTLNDLVPKNVGGDSSEILPVLQSLKNSIDRNTIITNNIYDRLVVQEDAQEDDEWEEV